MGEAAREGSCCFVRFCRISSPLSFLLFSLSSVVMADDSTYISVQVVGFFLDQNWKLLLDF